MILKVKHDELNNVKDVMVKDSELLDSEIKTLLEQIEKLRTIWQGQDATIFCNNVYEYINKMKTLPVTLRTMGKFINNINNQYTENDEAFGKELETEVDNYEQNNNY